MKNTMELFDRAMKKQRAAAWARDLNITPSTFSQAKKKRRLSPVLAGNLAIELGDDPVAWVARAALEAERETEQLTRLVQQVKSWRNVATSTTKKAALKAKSHRKLK